MHTYTRHSAHHFSFSAGSMMMCMCVCVFFHQANVGVHSNATVISHTRLLPAQKMPQWKWKTGRYSFTVWGNPTSSDLLNMCVCVCVCVDVQVCTGYLFAAALTPGLFNSFVFLTGCLIIHVLCFGLALPREWRQMWSMAAEATKIRGTLSV